MKTQQDKSRTRKKLEEIQSYLLSCKMNANDIKYYELAEVLEETIKAVNDDLSYLDELKAEFFRKNLNN
jgi:hypothetical protein